MTRKVYRGAQLEVTFDAGLCIHAAECVRGLPAVFDRNRRPWVVADNAAPDDVVTVIERCPSGALRYQHRDGSIGEQPASSVTVTPIENGPLLLRGNLTIRNESGVENAVPRAALCRCGHSKNMPFCDNSERDTGFRAPGVPR